MATNWFPQPNITNYTALIDYANSVTNDVFGSSIAWIIFIVIYSVFSLRNPPIKAFMASSYITWMLTILMRVMGWIPDYMLVIFGVMTAVSTALTFWKRTEVG